MINIYFQSIWAISFLATVFIDIVPGLIISIFYALFTTIAREQWWAIHFQQLLLIIEMSLMAEICDPIMVVKIVWSSRQEKSFHRPRWHLLANVHGALDFADVLRYDDVYFFQVGKYCMSFHKKFKILCEYSIILIICSPSACSVSIHPFSSRTSTDSRSVRQRWDRKLLIHYLQHPLCLILVHGQAV